MASMNKEPVELDLWPAEIGEQMAAVTHLPCCRYDGRS